MIFAKRKSLINPSHVEMTLSFLAIPALESGSDLTPRQCLVWITNINTYVTNHNFICFRLPAEVGGGNLTMGWGKVIPRCRGSFLNGPGEYFSEIPHRAGGRYLQNLYHFRIINFVFSIPPAWWWELLMDGISFWLLFVIILWSARSLGIRTRVRTLIVAEKSIALATF